MKSKVKIKNVVCLLLIAALLLLNLLSCGKYYDDENHKTDLPNRDFGGSDTLSVSQINGITTLENAKVRIKLTQSGSISEYINKESKLCLVENADSDAIRVEKNSEMISPQTAEVKIITDNSKEKQVQIGFDFGGGLGATATVSLGCDSDEVVFRIKLTGNEHENTALSVEYPIIDGIGSLYKKETDRFISPFITGCLFENPVENFNNEFYGISRSMGMYPNGWGLPMQFSAYYSEGVGGFYWQTRDGGDTIKSFTFTGTGDTLRLSIYHYLSDVCSGDKDFSYDIVMSNMTRGDWYEAANLYREWASLQSWATKKGVLSERTDYSKQLYEQTSLCVFGYRSSETSWKDCIAIYDMMKGCIDGKFFNIAIYKDTEYLNVVDEYEDLLACFEFPSIVMKSIASEEQKANAMKDSEGNELCFNIHYYECAAGEDWVNQQLGVDRNFVDTYGVDGFYYDVDIAADHPMLCYDESHTHGTRVNVLSDFYSQFAQAEAIADEEGFYNIGQEMITEQLLPYVDYYQARANGALLGWMEHDRIRTVIENGSAYLVPAFDYVYHSYGALRLDGYLIPDEKMGQGFYSVAAYTALNGGICEFNYEYYNASDLPSSSDISLDMLDFINRLGQLRSGIGKNYLVYGQMEKQPDVGSTSSQYEYENINYTPGTCNHLRSLSGECKVSDIVTSAFSHDNKIGIFMCNTSTETKDVSFILKAERDYGINAGTVYAVRGENREKIGTVKNGEAKIDIKLGSLELCMLEIQ